MGRKTLELCGLHGLDFEGYNLLSNGRVETKNIKCILDRGLAKIELIFIFFSH